MPLRASLLLVGFLVASISACTQDAAPGAVPDATVLSLHQVLSVQGAPAARLRADSAVLRPKRDHQVLLGLRLDLHARDGTSAGELRSSRAEFAIRAEHLVAEDVVLVLPISEGAMRVIRTREVRYDLTSGWLCSEEGFELQEADGTLRSGQRFCYDPGLRAWSEDVPVPESAQEAASQASGWAA